MKSEKKFRRKIKPVIPFERTPSKELATGEYVVIKCRVDVSNPQSPQYEIRVPYYREGTPEEWLYWLQNFRKALRGQVAQPVASDKFGMARRLLEGEALATFNMETAQRSEVEVDEGLGPIGETDIVFDAVITAMTK